MNIQFVISVKILIIWLQVDALNIPQFHFVQVSTHTKMSVLVVKVDIIEFLLRNAWRMMQIAPLTMNIWENAQNVQMVIIGMEIIVLF